MNHKLKLTKGEEEFYVVGTDDPSIGFNDIYTKKNKPTKEDVGLGLIPNKTSDEIELDDHESLATSKAVKTVNDKVELNKTNLGKLDEEFKNHNHDSRYLLKNETAKNSEKLNRLSIDYIVHGSTIKCNQVWSDKDIKEVPRSGFYQTNNTTTGLPDEANKNGVALVMYGNTKTIIYSDDTTGSMYLLNETNEAFPFWKKIPYGMDIQNMIYGSNKTGTMNWINKSANIINKSGFYYVSKTITEVELNLPEQMEEGYVLHEQNSKLDIDNCCQTFKSINEEYTFTRKKINGAWKEWKELSALGDSIISKIHQENHGFTFNGVCYENGAWKLVDITDEDSVDGIAVRIDDNYFNLYYGGIFNVDDSFMFDEKGAKLVEENYYFMSQNLAGAFQIERPRVGVSQSVFKVISMNGQRKIMLCIGDPIEVEFTEYDTYTTVLKTMAEANRVRRSGVYSIDSVETPSSGNGYIMHMQSGTTLDNATQIFFSATKENNDVWIRKMVAQNWFEWVMIGTSGSQLGITKEQIVYGENSSATNTVGDYDSLTKSGFYHRKTLARNQEIIHIEAPDNSTAIQLISYTDGDLTMRWRVGGTWKDGGLAGRGAHIPVGIKKSDIITKKEMPLKEKTIQNLQILQNWTTVVNNIGTELIYKEAGTYALNVIVSEANISASGIIDLNLIENLETSEEFSCEVPIHLSGANIGDKSLFIRTYKAENQANVQLQIYTTFPIEDPKTILVKMRKLI